MSSISEPARSPEADTAVTPAASAPGKPGVVRRWAGVAWRHKVLSGITAAFIVAIIVVSAVTARTATPSVGTTTDINWIPVNGSPAAAGFTLPALGDSAKQVSLAKYQGKPVIVNFFASWCSPCQQETPLLASWYKRQDGKTVLLGLDENDSTASAEKFIAAKGVTYPVGFDPATIAASGYAINELPQTFFLNAQHRIVGHWAGAMTTAALAKGLSLMNSAS